MITTNKRTSTSLLFPAAIDHPEDTIPPINAGMKVLVKGVMYVGVGRTKLGRVVATTVRKRNRPLQVAGNIIFREKRYKFSDFFFSTNMMTNVGDHRRINGA